MTIVLYDFEGPLRLDTLERPPLCALRALRMAGVLLTRAGWDATPHQARLKLALLGSQALVDRDAVRQALMESPPREMKMFPRLSEPKDDEVPEEVRRALGPGHNIPVEAWRALRPLDRHVLSMVRTNARLLWRALEEMCVPLRGANASAAAMGAWTGEVAHVELKVHPTSARRIAAADLHDGQALVLARTAGIRAARRAGEILDLHSQVITGAVELGFRVDAEKNPARILCQAHVSTTDGDFFRAASLLAATTAATALADLLADEDPHVCIDGARIAEEPWLAVEDDDETTLGM